MLKEIQKIKEGANGLLNQLMDGIYDEFKEQAQVVSADNPYS